MRTVEVIVTDSPMLVYGKYFCKWQDVVLQADSRENLGWLYSCMDAYFDLLCSGITTDCEGPMITIGDITPRIVRTEYDLDDIGHDGELIKIAGIVDGDTTHSYFCGRYEHYISMGGGVVTMTHVHNCWGRDSQLHRMLIGHGCAECTNMKNALEFVFDQISDKQFKYSADTHKYLPPQIRKELTALDIIENKDDFMVNCDIVDILKGYLLDAPFTRCK